MELREGWERKEKWMGGGQNRGRGRVPPLKKVSSHILKNLLSRYLVGLPRDIFGFEIIGLVYFYRALDPRTPPPPPGG